MSVIEVAIGPEQAPGTFRVRVLASSVGEASAVAELAADELLARRAELQQAVLASAVPSRRVLSETERCVREVGQMLFAALLGTGEVAGGTERLRQWRRNGRIELIEPGMPTAPIEHEAKAVDGDASARMVAEVRASALRATSASLDQLAASLPEPVVSISLRAWPPGFPDDIVVQRRPPWNPHLAGRNTEAL